VHYSGAFGYVNHEAGKRNRGSGKRICRTISPWSTASRARAANNPLDGQRRWESVGTNGIESKGEKSTAVLVRDSILAFRTVPGEVGIVYEIALTAQRDLYERDKHFISDLQKSFRLRPLPK
jgi:hypothetical protein